MFRPNPRPHPLTTTAHRSCSTPSCRRNPVSRRLRSAICPLLHSMTLNRTHGGIPASTMPRSRIVPTTRSVTSTKRPPRRRSTRPSTSRGGKTSSARQLLRSTCRPKARSPSRWRTARDRSPPIQPSRQQVLQPFAIPASASRPRPSISTTTTTHNRRLQSIALHRKLPSRSRRTPRHRCRPSLNARRPLHIGLRRRCSLPRRRQPSPRNCRKRRRSSRLPQHRRLRLSPHRRRSARRLTRLPPHRASRPSPPPFRRSARPARRPLCRRNRPHRHRPLLPPRRHRLPVSRA
ncbi:hypothetical protein BCCR75501_02369 [Burkholderia sola]|nr:hypothetical protein BCCR75389_02368 [Burkholderia cenocepacia]CAG2306805.1 hypothetical protein BCCR75390_02372 [Burkholderia cenocepacia]CAG2307026.1 hypothetical protein BCCR75588_02371 [Burkholderia cenocepacia]CAG2307280.1 hypothetical protein BCCR75501_02369 [Burkholderia cenocepacia]CAG2324616.1 hypothetical protein BCCR75597_02366 [Burkholderia cenocepacia]